MLLFITLWARGISVHATILVNVVTKQCCDKTWDCYNFIWIRQCHSQDFVLQGKGCMMQKILQKTHKIVYSGQNLLGNFVVFSLRNQQIEQFSRTCKNCMISILSLHCCSSSFTVTSYLTVLYRTMCFMCTHNCRGPYHKCKLTI